MKYTKELRVYIAEGSEILDDRRIILLALIAAALVIFTSVVNILESRGINSIKSKAVGDGQHGTARWATKPEIRQTFSSLPFEPELWRQGKNLPKVQGTVIGCHGKVNTTALVDTGDVHSLMIGAAGVGKTAYFLYPNIEFCCASGMSFLSRAIR